MKTTVNLSDSDEEVEEEGTTRAVVGARLMGIIPCSDARGYDVLIKDFREAE